MWKRASSIGCSIDTKLSVKLSPSTIPVPMMWKPLQCISLSFSPLRNEGDRRTQRNWWSKVTPFDSLMYVERLFYSHKFLLPLVPFVASDHQLSCKNVQDTHIQLQCVCLCPPPHLTWIHTHTEKISNAFTVAFTWIYSMTRCGICLCCLRHTFAISDGQWLVYCVHFVHSLFSSFTCNITQRKWLTRK